MTMYILNNDFHNTSCTVRADGVQHIWNEVEIKLSRQQAQRAWKKLCGISGCTCSDSAGLRGRQICTTNKGFTARLIVNFCE